MSRQSTDEVVMIRPARFYCNEQTAVNNAYQNDDEKDYDLVNKKAIEEFDELYKKLREKGVKVNLINDTKLPSTPDSIFPNNWFSTHSDGKIVIYSMFAQNRRAEVDKYLDNLISIFKNKGNKNISVLDLREFANDRFLEGTGSIVLDRINKIAYMVISPRSDVSLFNEFCDRTGYKPVAFNATHLNTPIYHTNVLMSVGEKNVIICLDLIDDDKERAYVKKTIEESGKNIIKISVAQYENYAGNALELNGKNGKLIAMSKTAYDSLNTEQIELLKKDLDILACDVPTIEYNGGGSVRCMLGEVF